MPETIAGGEEQHCKGNGSKYIHVPALQAGCSSRDKDSRRELDVVHDDDLLM